MPECQPEGDYPRRLHHRVPTWADPGSFFHIRLRVAPGWAGALTNATHGPVLLQAFAHYHLHSRWWCRVALLMPDHIHALLAFPTPGSMGRLLGEWKKFTTRQTRVPWQVNFFDHRIRSPYDLQAKFDYILRNPVVKGLCAHVSDWPWVWTPDGETETRRAERDPNP